MRIISLFFTSSFLLLLGCQTSSKNDQVRPETNHGLTFEDYRNRWITRLNNFKPRTPNTAVSPLEKYQALCLNDTTLCEGHLKQRQKKHRYSSSRAKEFFKFIEEDNWSQLQNFETSFSLAAFKRKRKTQLLALADKLSMATCEATEARHALGAILEDQLPEIEVLRATIDLYEKNSACPGKTAISSTYRAGMLRILEDRCDAAVPLLKKVITSSEDHLKSRSVYWSWNCLGQSREYVESLKKVIPYFSYHGLMINQYASHSLLEDTELKESTPILVKSNDHGLNQYLVLVEEQINLGEMSMARHLIEKMNMDRLQLAEPAYRMYWAYLMHLTQSGVRKFQVLAKLINENSEFRSKSVKSMLFPTWYFDSVSNYSSQADPWLIQSLIRQESAFDPRARSRVGATGLMQLMPATARRIGRINRHQLKDPEQNVRVGVLFFERLLERYDGDVHLALAAYNAGPGKVDEWLKRYPTQDPLLFSDIIPYKETREYVAFILRNYFWYQYLNGQQQFGSHLLSKQTQEITAVE